MAEEKFDPDKYLEKFDPDKYLEANKAPDKYQRAAIEERERLKAAGVPLQEGYTDRLARGAGIGWADEVSAFGQIPFEMIRRGTINPVEAYRYNKAFQDLKNKKTDENTAGVLGGAVEVLGGLGSAGGVLGGGTRAATTSGTSNYLRNVGTAAGLGGVAGAGEAPSISDIPASAAMGGVIGGTIGAALPPVTAAVKQVARAVQLPRLRDPQRVAVEQVEDVVRASGRSMDDIAQDVRNAHAAGQTDYTIADAIGKEGQRKLAAMAKAPGEQRQRIAELMDERNINMPARVSEEVGTALGAPGTARQAQDALIQEARTASRPLYAAAEQHGPVWTDRLQSFFDDPIMRQGLRQGVEVQRLESLAAGRRFDPNDYAIVNFDNAGDPIIGGVPNMRTINLAKIGLDDILEKYRDGVTGRLNLDARGRAIDQVRRALLQEVDALNPVYAEARRAFAGPASVREAVDTGRSMATRGRAADNVQRFEGMTPPTQQGARIGYADAAVTPMERSGNFPPLLREKSLKGSTELDALSLYQGPRRPGEPDQLRKFLNREERMIATKNAATGGSSTAENLADIANAPGGGEVLGLAASAASGRPLQFMRNAAEILARVGKGENEAQRVAITQALLARDPDAVAQLAGLIREQELRRRGVNPWGVRPPRFAR